MRLLFAGTPSAAVPTLDALLASRHDVVAVLTRPDARAGRGRQLVASEVALRAEEVGLPVLKPESLGDSTFHDQLVALRIDAAPIVAYGGLIPPAALAVPAHGWINLHFSVLPAWRGAAPVQRAIIAGDDVTGASTFILNEGLDTGPVLGVVTEPIGQRDTSGELLQRLSRSGAELMVRTLDALENGTAIAVAQTSHDVSRAPKLSVEESRVNWSMPAMALDRLVRGVTPDPGAWTTLSGERIGIGPVLPLPDDVSLAPGEVVADKAGVRVGTGSHAVVLGEVRPAGKRSMPAADWARGSRPAPGVRFE